jgi:mannose-1-phosphate guanylyltransferase
MILPLIMAGGSGTRLWPLSRQLHPKQFLPLGGTDTMLQMTISRLKGLDHRSPVIICNEKHRFLAAEQLRSIQPIMNYSDFPPIILEPAARNTAPAIALGALEAVSKGEDPLLLVLAADHLIPDVSAFHKAVNYAVPLAAKGQLVTFGIVPTHPETGYGYIQRGDSLGSEGFHLKRFVEKPVLSIAEQYLKSGDYYWNSGMFLFKASRYLEELGLLAPKILNQTEIAFKKARKESDFLWIDKESFEACPEDSIDYAVMEKVTDAAVIPLDAGWSDIGSWAALWDVMKKDESQNVSIGDVISVNSASSLLYSTSRLIAAVGLDNMVVVETADSVLVASKDKVQDIKKIVDELKRLGRSEHLDHNVSQHEKLR